MIINKKKVKDYIRSIAPAKRISKGYYDALDAKVRRVIVATVESARRFMTITEGDVQ